MIKEYSNGMDISLCVVNILFAIGACVQIRNRCCRNSQDYYTFYLVFYNNCVDVYVCIYMFL